MNKDTGNYKNKRNEPPVQQYRKEIGHHQEVIERPSSIKRRRELQNKEKMAENELEAPKYTKGQFYTFLIIFGLIMGGIYFFLKYAGQPVKHPFVKEDAPTA